MSKKRELKTIEVEQLIKVAGGSEPQPVPLKKKQQS